MNARNVYPIPDTRRHKTLKAGPWMLGKQRPVRDGMYLRDFAQDGHGEAMSWWRHGKWMIEDFWDTVSDVQDAPWRGAVRKNARP